MTFFGFIGFALVVLKYYKAIKKEIMVHMWLLPIIFFYKTEKSNKKFSSTVRKIQLFMNN